jgi:AcrR family transcriptional regulator
MTKPNVQSESPPVEAILAVAEKLFANRGYDATSMREIAEGAGVAKPTVYYYFQSKEGLLARLLDHSFSSLREEIKAVNARDDSADAFECLVDAVWLFFKSAQDHPDLIRFIHILIFGPARQPERLWIEEAFGGICEEFKRVLKRAVEKGVMRADHLAEADMALRGVTTNYVIEHLQGRAELTRDLARRIVDGFLEG